MILDQYCEKCVNCYSVMCHVGCQYKQRLYGKQFLFLHLHNTKQRDECCLLLIPVKALCTVLGTNEKFSAKSKIRIHLL